MSNEIREAVQIVLARMETHPEDFYDDMRINSRFAWVWNAIRPNTEHQYGLTEAEVNVLRQGFDKLMYRKFHDRVLESLLNNEQDEKMKYQVKERYALGHTDPRNLYIQAQHARNIAARNIAALNVNSTLGISNALTANSVQIGKQTLTEALVQKLKNL